MVKWIDRAVPLLAATTLTVSASEGAIDYRQHAMSAVGGHMQAVADIVRQKVPHTSHLQMHANALADLAAITPTLFPEGSVGGDSLPAIWEDAEDFETRLTAFKKAANDLKAVASGSDRDAIGRALRNLGQACKGCHDSYRKE